MRSAAEVKYAVELMEDYAKHAYLNHEYLIALKAVIEAAQSWADERTV